MTQSFETQLEACLPDLWRFAWSLTRDRDAADDLVQDCVERALRRRLLWLPGRPLKPWMTKILLNLFRDRWRRQSQFPTVDLAEVSNVAANAGSAEERLQVQAVWARVQQVPRDQREALLAVVVGGLTYEEAAKALGIPKGTLMSRISRARAKIRDATETASAAKIRSIK